MADTSFRIAGTAFLNVDGTNFTVAGEAEYCPSVFKRETLAGMSGIDGYAERFNIPHISMQLRDMGGLELGDINAMTNVTVTLELANGKTVVGRNMWTVEEQTGKATDGTVDVRWEGKTVIES